MSETIADLKARIAELGSQLSETQIKGALEPMALKRRVRAGRSAGSTLIKCCPRISP
jgi:hypothetical protein